MNKLIVILSCFFFLLSCNNNNPISTSGTNDVIGNPKKILYLEVAEYDFKTRMNWHDANKSCKELGDGWRFLFARWLCCFVVQSFIPEGQINIVLLPRIDLVKFFFKI